jgi:hydrogenase nickel incorporation protein HypA/HybF
LIASQTMHEASLVRSLLKQANQLAVAHGAARINAIRVQIGPLAGVEPLLFNDAFRHLAPATIAAQAVLQIDIVPLKARCANCEQAFTAIELRFDCPACGSQRIEVTAGDGVILESVTLEVGNSGDVGSPDSGLVHHLIP